MKRYSVVTTPSAEADIIDSFIWGCDAWGVEEAENWANELRSKILKNLSTYPFKYAVALDKDESGREYRQMIVGRYRVIFHIEKLIVSVIHITGSFVGSDKNPFEEISE